MQVIAMRFGEYKEVFDPETALVKHDIPFIAKTINASYSTCKNLLFKYMKDRRVKCFERKQSRKKKLTEEQEEQICDKEYLQK